MHKELRPEQVDILVGSPAVNDEFSKKVRELDRRLQVNGMSYRDWEVLNDRQQDIFSNDMFLDGECATSIKDYVHGAVNSCGCPDTVEDLHHHSPVLMKEIEKQQDMLPDIKIKIGENLKGLNGMIDILLEQLLDEEKAKIVPYKETKFTPVMRGYVRNNIAKANKLKITKDPRKGYINKFASPAGQDNAELKDLKPFFKKYGFDIDETDTTKSTQYY